MIAASSAPHPSMMIADEEANVTRRPSRLTMVTALSALLLTVGLASGTILNVRNQKAQAQADAPIDSNPEESSSSRALRVTATYYPGMLNVYQSGLLLSQGLTARIIARSGSPVKYDTTGRSRESAHYQPDFGATFPDPSATNPGGWIYVSNSENRTFEEGGAGAFTFNSNGKLIKFKPVLKGSTANCGGGYTPWNTYITCEEKPNGLIYQVDPAGRRSPEVITMGLETNGGQFESFAAYDANRSAPQFFATEDYWNGVVRRFIPYNPDWTQPWNMLTGNGTVDYLLVNPVNMTFNWTTNVTEARENANINFPNTEGIDRSGGLLYFVTKVFKSMFILDLEAGTYTNVTTKNGAFDGQPDQIISILGPTKAAYQSLGWLYFTEDGGSNAGIYARNNLGFFYSILQNANPKFPNDETTGLAFSPDGKHMLFALQDAGLIYQVSRLDGLPFQAKKFNIKYHDSRR